MRVPEERRTLLFDLIEDAIFMLTPANQAIEEIKAILRKYDLAGTVIVQSPKEAAYLTEISPSWSCARFEEHTEGTMLRIRSKLAEYGGDVAKQKETVEHTLGMLMTLRNQSARMVDGMDSVVAMIADTFPNFAHVEQENTPAMGPFLRQVESIMRHHGLPFDHTEPVWDALHAEGYTPDSAVHAWRTLRGK